LQTIEKHFKVQVRLSAGGPLLRYPSPPL
jgi:hypothetical protein